MGRSTAVIGTFIALWAGLVVQGQCHTPFFIFGDSLLDAGNNQYFNSGTPKSSLPYGETFFKRPSGRSCDGRIVADFLAEYANLPLIRPYLEPGFSNYSDGANFASAGAGILPETNPRMIHLKMQLSYFEEVQKKLKQQEGEQKAQELLSKAVYLFSMGGNDYMNVGMPKFGNTMPPVVLTASYKKQYVTIVLSNLTSVVKKVYAMGGRKFIFQTVGPLGCMPVSRYASGSTGCVHDVTVLAKMHNIALSKLLLKLEKTLPGFKYALFDYYSALAEITTYPSRFGFKEGRTACCGSGNFNGQFTCGKNGTAYNLCSDPSQYVWFDAAHPTESANKHLTSLFWSGPLKVVWPYNAKALFQMP
ncbi:GDSL esterase/lipase 4-like [Punica granatum]|uniref:GDSL esterase/lipase 4-like n=1 Tax=Punica granatum TaxID=22663 RepID=A0A6P8BWL0_PUNGR|nr:GDSL esterase/lipase 4-like [Punica granatum]